jgi:hypothetical protein
MTELQIPSWARPQTRDAQSEAEAGFKAGASLAILDRLLAAPMAHRGVWLDRLALRAATASTRAIGRTEDEAAIRDATTLRQGSADPGPAGRLLTLWRRLAGRSPTPDPAAIRSATALIGVTIGEDLIAQTERLANSTMPAIAAAAEILLACHGDRPERAIMGCWLADMVLARRLRWPIAVPLLAGSLLNRSWRTSLAGGGRGGAAPDLTRWFHGTADAAAFAVNLAIDLERRAEILIAVSPKLRAKAADKVVERLLNLDAIAASEPFPGISDRGLRRLLDRLHSLGAIRELSGRSSFRLYGL